MTPDAEFLHRYHATHPGATPRSLGHWHIDDTDRSSYDLLADFLVEQARGEMTVDLGCGDGALAEKLLAADGGPLAVIGVDASPEELKKAKRRLRLHAVLHHGTADRLPIPTGEVAAVGCHMALMLMQPIDPILDEVVRVLQPGGVFGAIVGAPIHAEPAMQTFTHLLDALPEEQRPPRPRLGDPRTRSAEGLQSLLSERFGRVEITPHRFGITAPAAELWPTLALTYDTFALTPEGQEALKTAFIAELGDAPVRCGHGVLMVRAWT